MFSVPLSLTTDTAFELPGYLHESGAHNPWVEANLNGRDVHSHFGGLCFDVQGRLWIADTPFGRIFRVTPTGEWDQISRYDGWPCGLKFHADGRLIIADQRHGILALDTDTRHIAPLVTHHVSQRFFGVSHLLYGSSGDLYFSDRGQSGLQDPSGAVYRLKVDGQLQKLFGDIPAPCGLALTHDERFLLVAVAGDNAIWRAPLVDGGVSRVSRFIQLSGGIGPEGLTIDSDDNVYIAHRGLGCVWQFDKRGEPKYRIDSTRGDLTADVCIHPDHPNEIFSAEAQTGSILKATLPLY